MTTIRHQEARQCIILMWSVLAHKVSASYRICTSVIIRYTHSCSLIVPSSLFGRHVQLNSWVASCSPDLKSEAVNPTYHRFREPLSDITTLLGPRRSFHLGWQVGLT